MRSLTLLAAIALLLFATPAASQVADWTDVQPAINALDADGDGLCDGVEGSLGFLLAADIDTLTELNTVITDATLLDSAALDSEAELETQIGGDNLIVSTEIDTLAEIEALTGVDIIEAGELPSGSTTVVSFYNPDVNMYQDLSDCQRIPVAGTIASERS